MARWALDPSRCALCPLSDQTDVTAHRRGHVTGTSRLVATSSSTGEKPMIKHYVVVESTKKLGFHFELTAVDLQATRQCPYLCLHRASRASCTSAAPEPPPRSAHIRDCR